MPEEIGVSAQDVQGTKGKPIRNGEAVLPPWARKRCNATSHASTVNLSGIQGRLQSYMCGKICFLLLGGAEVFSPYPLTL